MQDQLNKLCLQQDRKRQSCSDTSCPEIIASTEFNSQSLHRDRFKIGSLIFISFSILDAQFTFTVCLIVNHNLLYLFREDSLRYEFSTFHRDPSNTLYLLLQSDSYVVKLFLPFEDYISLTRDACIDHFQYLIRSVSCQYGFVFVEEAMIY